MNHLVLTPDRDTQPPPGKPPTHDYVGAFKPESGLYTKHYRAQGDTVTVVRIDVSKRGPERVAQVVAALTAAAPVDRLAVFSHGWRTGIQFGLSTSTAADRERLVAFAAMLVAASTPELKLALYCCSTGASDGPPGDGGDGGFADLLRDALVAAGRPNVTVFAHTTAGHTTRNPAVRFFLPGNGYGGIDLAKHTTPEGRRLRARLADGNDALRWRLPYLSLDEARAEIAVVP